MSRCHQAARPIALCLRPRCSTQVAGPSIATATARLFSNSTVRSDGEPTTTISTAGAAADAQAMQHLVHANATPDTTISPDEATRRKELKAQWLDPNTTVLPWAEKKLQKRGIELVGSRRRRAAVRQTAGIPFEQLPYHCFQEARKVLAADRAIKLEEIKKAHQRVKTVEAMPAEKYKGGELGKSQKLKSLREHLEYLKVQADINDPTVKRKWEDGFADMSKPVYRHFNEQKWRSMDYQILAQRVKQFHIVPDVLPKFDPKMDVQLTFHGYRIRPGEIVDSLVSEAPPNLRLQIFDSQKRLASVVVMDSDVPNAETDSYGSRLHFMAANIPIDCLTKNISLIRISKDEEKMAVPWLPPFSQEGAPYHRLSVWILEQPNGKPLDVSKLRERYSEGRDGFSLQKFQSYSKVQPYGFNMFRTIWDNGTEAVMKKHGIAGSEIVFRRQRVRSLKPPKKARGWEAKRQGPKYRHLWKYTKNIGRNRGGT
ncbi:phosphatidylethanolamine-binding protein [Coniella lustricola]|uniref:Large ribosomal subunit protein mL38 n=1 Tax=Coniella lustricola TaxID=2025994 RepID=A0A2T3AJP3_9PEZI|nr:phosphatidylethanolamine-binding protein [Coniella lustricola]